MPFVKVYIHFVWSTKNRAPFLNTPELRNQVWQHIRENGKEKNLFIDTVNGFCDHCHCLLSLGTDQTLQKVIQLIKGESSFWINRYFKSEFSKQKFKWQNEYYAVAVGESMLEQVRQYIKNQEEHHKTKSFQQEYPEFLK